MVVVHFAFSDMPNPLPSYVIDSLESEVDVGSSGK